MTDIGSKIDWQFTNKKNNIAFIFTILFCMFLKEKQNGVEKEKNYREMKIKTPKRAKQRGKKEKKKSRKRSTHVELREKVVFTNWFVICVCSSL